MAGMVDGRDRQLASVQAPALRGVELVTATFRGPAPTPVLLSQLMIAWCEAGGGDVAWGRQLQRLERGAVLLRAPHQVSMVLHDVAPETRCRIALVEPELLPLAPIDDARRLASFGSLVTREPNVVEPMSRLCHAVEVGGDAEEQQSQLASLLAAVLALVAHETPRPPLLTPAVQRTRETLHERFAEEVPLEELASIAGMSKCHLVHLFHKEVGLPPHAYQIQLRVARARVLVAAGVALAEVATMTGFADQSHLTRLFKRVVGVPPGQYAALLATRATAIAPPSMAMSH